MKDLLAASGQILVAANPSQREDGAMGIVSSEIQIDGTPEVVYALVSDVKRTGEWSPECVRCRWLRGATAAVAGARYRGASRNGWRRWSTTSTIRVARPGAELVWDVTYLGRPVARWSYRLSALDGGRTLLEESVDDRRERWLQIVSPWITGARDRAARNADTIGTTLYRIKVLAEASTANDPRSEREEGGVDLDGRTPPSPGVGGSEVGFS